MTTCLTHHTPPPTTVDQSVQGRKEASVMEGLAPSVLEGLDTGSKEDLEEKLKKIDEYIASHEAALKVWKAAKITVARALLDRVNRFSQPICFTLATYEIFICVAVKSLKD
jgi:hypothetical protein